MSEFVVVVLRGDAYTVEADTSVEATEAVKGWVVRGEPKPASLEVYEETKFLHLATDRDKFPEESLYKFMTAGVRSTQGAHLDIRETAPEDHRN